MYLTWKGVECFPFVHWGMYSGKAQAATTTEVLQIKISDKKVCISCLPDLQGAVVNSSFEWYYHLQRNSLEDTTSLVFKDLLSKFPEKIYQRFKRNILNRPDEIVKYPRWLFTYLADMRIIENPSLECDIVKVRYGKDFCLDSIATIKAARYQYLTYP
ncbi:MAG: hypothetical protein RMJ53_05430 [Chitinophagales bacterium]|nr:hypothetical protein [Chitinophagales bacterium]MDW8273652.1 hypothetical protein [Chitinophagales bacterium]